MPLNLVREVYTIITEADLTGLPTPVQCYLRYSGVVGKPWVQTVRLKYMGEFRMAADKPWIPLAVTQFYTTNPPGFLWKAQFKMLGVPFMFATDTYRDGHSHMLGKVAGLFTVVDGSRRRSRSGDDGALFAGDVVVPGGVSGQKHSLAGC